MKDPAFDPKAKRLWGVIARDRRNSNVRWFPITFGFSASAEEAMVRVQKQLIADMGFRDRYRGWVFSPFLADFCVDVKPTGAFALMNKNEGIVS